MTAGAGRVHGAVTNSSERARCAGKELRSTDNFNFQLSWKVCSCTLNYTIPSGLQLIVNKNSVE